MNLLHFVTITGVGFVGCAEFGSFAFVHPVLRRLPPEQWLTVERGLLRTFGRVMPVGMTAAPVLAGSTSSSLTGAGATIGWAATVTLAVALATTIAVNVGINAATGGWDPTNPPSDWREKRRRWDQFQGVRATLQLIGFGLVTAGVLA